MAGTKNLGQVAGLFIGTSAPQNTTLIWYDSTPSMKCHKVYSESLSQWVVLDSSTISATTYSQLVTKAQGTGLAIGEWFKITDKGNALALAISTTKVQYADSQGNLLIDDLGTSIQYIVNSNNLLIDDVNGVYNTATGKLVFSFDILTPDYMGNDYLLGKAKRNNVWKLAKFGIQSLLSSISGNAITWNSGFYLDFGTKLATYMDVTGGVVSKAVYDTKIAELTQTVNNTAANQQAIAAQATAAVAAATTDVQIYSKQLPVAPDAAAAANILQFDTLQTIVLKCQRWFNTLRWATGVHMSTSYAAETQKKYVNNNDSTETAIAKLDWWVRQMENPTAAYATTDAVKLASGYSQQHRTLTPGTTSLTQVLEELAYRISINAQPLNMIIMFYAEPVYDNVWGSAGYGWFPIGNFFAGTQTQVNTEKAKWTAKYGAGVVGFGETTVSGTVYLRISTVVVNGSTKPLPNVNGKFLRQMIKAPGVTSYAVGDTGGQDEFIIETANLPNHTHSVSIHEQADHNHGGNTGENSDVTLTKENNGDYSDSGPTQGRGLESATGNDWARDNTLTFTVPKHKHSISNGGGFSHSHTVNGGGQASPTAIDNRPAFLTVAYLIRML